MPRQGATAQYRPVPRDFDEMFIRVGWGGIEAHCNAHARNIAKWIAIRDEERATAGQISLRSARAAYVGSAGRAVSSTKIAYVGARHASRVAPIAPRPFCWPMAAPKFWEVGLLPEPAPLAVRRARHRSRMMAVTKAAELVEKAAQDAATSEEFAAGMARAAQILRAQAEVA